jgi:hypothetical protein
MVTRKLLYTASAMVMFALLATASTRAQWFDLRQTTYLTFSGPVRLPGVSLPAGTYTFELPVPDSSFQLVRVSSRDGRHVYFTGFTNVIDRPADLPPSQSIVFGEASTRTPPPIKAWFPQDERTGRQFIY